MGAVCWMLLQTRSKPTDTRNEQSALQRQRLGSRGTDQHDRSGGAEALTSMPRRRKPIMHRRHLNVKLS